MYKGNGWLDLRAAELTAAETTLLAVAYKSRITILVPPGVRVEASGFGADTDTEAGRPSARRRSRDPRPRLQLTRARSGSATGPPED